MTTIRNGFNLGVIAAVLFSILAFGNAYASSQSVTNRGMFVQHSVTYSVQATTLTRVAYAGHVGMVNGGYRGGYGYGGYRGGYGYGGYRGGYQGWFPHNVFGDMDRGHYWCDPYGRYFYFYNGIWNPLPWYFWSIINSYGYLPYSYYNYVPPVYPYGYPYYPY